MSHWIDEEVTKRFNGRLEHGVRKETVESLRRLYDLMPSQRVGVLYDFIRYIKREYDALDPTKQHLLRRRMAALGRFSG